MFEEVSDFDDPRLSLEEFLVQVKRLIWAIAYEDYLSRVRDAESQEFVFEGDDLASFQNAVGEYRESEQFELLLALIREAPSAILDAHGLSGQQLFVKRQMVRRNEQRFLARPTGRIFRKFLQAVDVLLDSILAAVPVGTALSELKDVAGLLPDTT